MTVGLILTIWLVVALIAQGLCCEYMPRDFLGDQTWLIWLVIWFWPIIIGLYAVLFVICGILSILFWPWVD